MIIDKRILKIINKYGYVVYDNIDTNIISINIHPDGNALRVTRLENGRHKIYKIDKIGKILKEIIPEINLIGNQEVESMMVDIKNLDPNENNEHIDLSEYEFEVSSEITKWYIDLSETWGISSCVNDHGASKLLKSIEADGRIKIVILKTLNGDCVGRCLLWEKLEGLDAPMIDRTYPQNDLKVNSIYRAWAQSNGYHYRNGMTGPEGKRIDGVETKVSYNMGDVDNLYYLPYMDTMKFGIINEENELVLYNHSVNNKYDQKFDEPGGINISDIVSSNTCFECGNKISADDDIMKIKNYDGDIVKIHRDCMNYEEHVRCYVCDYYCEDTRYIEGEDYSVCTFCYDAAGYDTCHDCEIDYDTEHLTYYRTRDGKYSYCDRCAEALHFCYVCNYYFSDEDEALYNVKSGDVICENCFVNYHFIECEECNYAVKKDRAVKHNDAYYCEICDIKMKAREKKDKEEMERMEYEDEREKKDFKNNRNFENFDYHIKNNKLMETYLLNIRGNIDE